MVRSDVNAAGGMTLPEEPGVIGWYSAGARPGATQGSTVLAGHIDSPRTDTGVLAALAEAKVGQVIVVRVPDGRGFAYRISRIENFHRNRLPMAQTLSSEGPHRLTMIMIMGSGRLLGRGLGYERNLVVTADPVPA